MELKLYILFIFIHLERILWLPGMGPLLATKKRREFVLNLYLGVSNKHKPFKKCKAHIITEHVFISITVSFSIYEGPPPFVKQNRLITNHCSQK